MLALLFGGCYVNRNPKYAAAFPKWNRIVRRSIDEEEVASRSHSIYSTDSAEILLPPSTPTSPTFSSAETEPKWRRRTLQILSFKFSVTSPNTKVFEDRWLSQMVHRFPFLAEVLYWALIYWVCAFGSYRESLNANGAKVYQLGRAFTAVTLVEGTVHVARRHALQLIHLEQQLHIFYEVEIQRFFLQYPSLMACINSIYSFIHIPATILFLIWLFWYTESRTVAIKGSHEIIAGESTLNQAPLYEARRRTMALCNLLAFIVFTAWPCMPPRLLSDPNIHSPAGSEGRKYGFVDTVHGDGGQGSVWTQNKFCNQYAAMPSLHFGYSLLIGLTIMTIPLKPTPNSPGGSVTKFNLRGTTFHVRLPSAQRALCLTLGFLYPFIILVAIVATANHFIIDAIAGAVVCGIAWNCNDILLNLLPLQDCMLWCMRVHFVSGEMAASSEKYEVEEDGEKSSAWA